jgi:hypothetical protein
MVPFFTRPIEPSQSPWHWRVLSLYWSECGYSKRSLCLVSSLGVHPARLAMEWNYQWRLWNYKDGRSLSQTNKLSSRLWKLRLDWFWVHQQSLSAPEYANLNYVASSGWACDIEIRFYILQLLVIMDCWWSGRILAFKFCSRLFLFYLGSYPIAHFCSEYLWFKKYRFFAMKMAPKVRS